MSTDCCNRICRSSLLIILTLSIVIIFTSAISATSSTKIAYIYDKTVKIDNNAVNFFTDRGYSVDFIKASNLSSIDFSKYLFLFVGDEAFTNDQEIPVFNYPAIIANSYHGTDWGFVNRNGISLFGATSPLKVIYNNTLLQVYTQATIGGVAIPYYFLGTLNKAPGIIQIAKVPPSSSSFNDGDVVSLIPAGIELLNNKVVNSSSCFYGITKSAYWTQNAKDLLQICLDKITYVNCNNNLDCGVDRYISDPFCSANDINQTKLIFTCNNPGTTKSFCSNTTTNEFQETCSFQCLNGTCLNSPVCGNGILEPGEQCDDGNTISGDGCSSTCKFENITCHQNSDCGIDGFIGQTFCTLNNVSQQFINYTCNNPGTPLSFCSDNVTERPIQTCSDVCISGQCVNITCSTDQDCNDSNPLTLDQCINPGTPASECRNTRINCNNDLDCGPTGFVGSEFCSNNSAVKNFQNSTCNNPGTLNSFCKIDVAPRIINQCQFACFDGGVCIRCDSNSDCDDSNSTTIDTCINPGTLISYCQNTLPVPICGNNITEPGEQCDLGPQNGVPGSGCSSTCQIETPLNITCHQNSDCGNTTQSDNFCTLNNVTRNQTTFTCNNPGTADSYCSSSTTKEVIQECSDFCNAGSCNNFTCSHNSDCGTDTESPLFCTLNNVTRNQTTFTCNNPGTLNSFCTSQNSTNVIEECSDFCSNGQCQGFVCRNDSDCNDNNVTTFDQCINPATPESFCRHTPLNCNNDLDCGPTGFVGSEFCSNNSAVKNFQNSTCNNPGTLNSFCTVDVAPRIIDQCQFACFDGGVCIRCDSNSDCDDSNSTTIDTCINPGTLTSFCQNVVPSPVCGNNITEPGEQCDDGNTISGDGCSSTCQIETPVNITCHQNSDCGNTTQSDNFCTLNNVTRNQTTFTCNNAGTPESFCSSQNATQIIQECEGICSEGQCQSQINCSRNSDCGYTGFIGTEFCANNDVTKNYQNSTCHNPSTSQSFCTVAVTSRTIQICGNACFSGACIVCNENSDCGTDGFIGLPYCSAQNVVQQFKTYACRNPGEKASYCYSQTSTNITQVCNYMCSIDHCVNP